MGIQLETRGPRKALTGRMTLNLEEERKEGRSEASALLVMCPSSCLTLPGVEMLSLVCWWHPGFSPHQFNHPCLLPCHTVLMTEASLRSSPVSMGTGTAPEAQLFTYPMLVNSFLWVMDPASLYSTPRLRPEINRLTMRDRDTGPLTLVSIASRTFSDKRARPPWPCPLRPFPLHRSVLNMGLRGSGSHFHLPPHTAL